MTTSTDYCGTGMSFSELSALPRHKRNTILARVLYALDQQIEPLADQRKSISNWLQQDMFANGADLIDAGEFEVKRDETTRWEYDPEGLTQLLAFGVTPEQFERAVQPTVKVSKAELNKLKRLGKHIASIIDENCRRHVTGTKITVQHKKTEVRPEPRVYSVDEDGVVQD